MLPNKIVDSDDVQKLNDYGKTVFGDVVTITVSKDTDKKIEDNEDE